MKHEEYKELLEVAALDALDAAEGIALEAHLAECATCPAEADAWREVAAALALPMTPVKPSAAVRERLLEAIRTQSPPVRAIAAPGAQTNGEHAAAQTSNVVSLDSRRERRGVIISKPLLTFGSIAASVAIAALAVTLALLWSQNKALKTQLAQMSDSLRQTEQEIGSLRADRELLAAPDARAVALAGTKDATKAQARLTFDQRTGRAILVAANLPPAPAGKAYQLWFIAGGKPLPGGLFRPDATGHAELHDTVPTAGRNANTFAVTLEPQGGVPAPTGSMYLLSAAS
ncbi:MAG: anti-sigma factor [Acidobacteriota bacterium]|nr:anti-sigma factor [Acidobacteriota bacterium]